MVQVINRSNAQFHWCKGCGNAYIGDRCPFCRCEPSTCAAAVKAVDTPDRFAQEPERFSDAPMGGLVIDEA